MIRIPICVAEVLVKDPDKAQTRPGRVGVKPGFQQWGLYTRI